MAPWAAAAAASALCAAVVMLPSCGAAAAPAPLRTLLAPPTPPASPRTRASFDFDWRFLLGSGVPMPAYCNASIFPVPLNDVQCLGQTGAAAASPAACQAACCALPGCTQWQYNPSAGCWTGFSGCADNLTSTAWVGAGMPPASPPPTSSCTDPASPCARNFNDSAWRALSVPHDFIIEGTFNPAIDPSHGSLPRNVSWYRKTFTVDAAHEGDLVWLTFDGVFRAADVYVNGAFVRHHEEGYTSFIAYIHNASVPLSYGAGGPPNVVAVYVDATQAELWSEEGGGIFRHVWLETARPVSMTPLSLYGPTVVTGTITGGDVNAPQTADGALLLPRVDIANAGPTPIIGGVVTFALLPPDSPTPVLTLDVPFNLSVGGWVRVAPGGGDGLPFGSPAAPVALWNTAMRPPQYTLTAAVTVGGAVVDALAVRIGVRSAVFSAAQGFLLNGVKTLVQGTSNHIGFGGVGSAVPDRVAEFIVSTLRTTLGSNGFRTAHNPVAPELLDAADAYGLLVWEENRFVTAGVQPLRGPPPSRLWPREAEGNGEVTAAAGPVHGGGRRVAPPAPPTPQPQPGADPLLLSDAADMVLRDRNHPCIIIWSLCNELGCVADSATGATLAAQFKEAIYAADTSRPITGNTVQSPYLSGAITDGFARAMDVQSFSYEYTAYAQFHASTPWKAVGGGESASCTADRGYYGPTNSSGGHLGPSSRDAFACAASGWAPVAQSTYAWGNFAWTGLDYMGETYPLGRPDVSSHFGIFDLAGFPKDSAAYYTSWWRDAPGGCVPGTSAFVSLSPSHWTAPVPVGAPIDVYAFTCAAGGVSLYLNGALIGAANTPVPAFGYALWPAVPYAAGNLTAVAFAGDGTVAATTTLLTAGAPYRLRAWVEDIYAGSGRSGYNLTADGQDAALIGVAVEDASGVMCPDPQFNVTFTVTGPGAVIGVANGDPADNSPLHASWRLTWKGLARAIVASAAPGDTGDIVVAVSVPGLQPAEVVVTASM